MSMTRKHFQAIADSVAEVRRTYTHPEEAANGAVDDVARNLAATLGRFNTSFDRERFLTACGVEVD